MWEYIKFATKPNIELFRFVDSILKPPHRVLTSFIYIVSLPWIIQNGLLVAWHCVMVCTAQREQTRNICRMLPTKGDHPQGPWWVWWHCEKTNDVYLILNCKQLCIYYCEKTNCLFLDPHSLVDSSPILEQSSTYNILVSGWTCDAIIVMYWNCFPFLCWVIITHSELTNIAPNNNLTWKVPAKCKDTATQSHESQFNFLAGRKWRELSTLINHL